MERRTIASVALAGALTLVGTFGTGIAGATPGDHPHGEAPGQARQDSSVAGGAEVHGSANGHGNGNGHAHGNAPGGRDAGPAVSEDNDTNDGGTPNNVADEGDNQHPSGRDRSVEHGNSGNQGNSTSDPDDDGRGPDRSNGGADKPDGPGGEDLADQDGNNGCGNDDDFEDDNEGWCGRRPKPAEEPAPAAPAPAPATGSPATADRDADESPARTADDDEHDDSTGGTTPAAPATSDACTDGEMDSACQHACAEGDMSDACAPSTTECAEGAMSDACAVAAAVDVSCSGSTADACAHVLPLEAELPGWVPTRGVATVAAAGGVAEVPAATAGTVHAVSAGEAILADLAMVPGPLGAVAAGALAFTGASTVTMVIAALVLLLVGAFLVRTARRQAALA